MRVHKGSEGPAANLLLVRSSSRLVWSFLLLALLPAVPAGAAAAEPAGSFFDRAAFPTRRAPVASTLADLDDDGVADLVTAVGLDVPGGEATQGFSVMRGRPGGGFDPARRFSAGGMPRTFQVIDLDGDGHLDVVAVVDEAGTPAAVRLAGDGAGDLGPPQHLALPPPQRLAIGRFAPGGLPQAAVSTPEGLAVYRQEPGSRFVLDRQLGDEPAGALLAADLDGAGGDELVAASADAVTLYRDLQAVGSVAAPYVFSLEAAEAAGADGREVLAVAQSRVDVLSPGPAGLSRLRSLASSNAAAAAAGDLDGDGSPEVVVAEDLLALVHRGTGGQPVVVPLASEASDVLVADANDDANLDLLAVETGASVVEVVEGDGAGRFPAPRASVATSAQAEDMAVADFDEDGHVDFVASEFEFGLPNLHLAQVYRGNGQGGFTRGAELATDGQPGGIAVGDFNNDDHADVAIGDFQLGVSQFLGNGDGTFSPRIPITPCRLVTALVAADLDEDGDDDVAATCRSSFYPGFVAVLPGSPAGLLPAAQVLPSTVGGDSFVIDAGDLNGDGNLDLVVGYYTETLVYYLGQANGLFAGFRSVATDGDVDGLATGDLDGDGRAEAVVTYPAQDRVHVFRAGPTGDLVPGELVPTFDTPYEVRVTDLDGDGHRDLLLGHGPNAVSVTPGGPEGLRPPSAYVVRQPAWYDLAVADVNEDGRRDVLGASSSSVEVLLGRA